MTAATTTLAEDPFQLVRKGMLGALKTIDPALVNVNKPDEDGRTLLHWAVSSGQLNTVEYLVETLSAKLDIEDEDGWTALHIASSIGSSPIVDFLLQHGAKVDCGNAQGNTPLFYAVGKQHLPVCQLLIDRYEANILHKNRNAQTVLHRASSVGNMPFLKEYQEQLKGIVDLRDSIDGNTALHLACEQQNANVADFLVSVLQARSDIKNSEGQLAVELCQDKRPRDHLQRLFSNK